MDRGQEPSLLAIVSHHILLAHQVELLVILPEEKLPSVYLKQNCMATSSLLKAFLEKRRPAIPGAATDCLRIYNYTGS